MKILIRRLNAHTMVWKKARVLDKNQFEIDVDGKPEKVSVTNVISIYNDNRDKYLVCSSCGEIVRNTPKEIKRHLDKKISTDCCLDCGNFRIRNANTIKKSIHFENNRCISVTKQEGVPCCMSGYGYRNVLAEDGKSGCMYKGCGTETLHPIEDVFTKYKGVFDDLITVDKVIDAGYKARRTDLYYDNYELKARNTIIVHVSRDTNIVTHFTLEYHRETFYLMYSKKYDKIFYIYRNDFIEEDRICRRCNIPESTLKNVKEKIASLYR